MKEINEIGLTQMNNCMHFLYMNCILVRVEVDAIIKKKVASQLAEFKAAIAVENEILRTLTSNRTDKKTGTLPVDALKDTRKASDEAYHILTKTINAIAFVEGGANYAAFIDYVNMEIVHYKCEMLGHDNETPAPTI